MTLLLSLLSLSPALASEQTFSAASIRALRVDTNGGTLYIHESSGDAKVIHGPTSSSCSLSIGQSGDTLIVRHKAGWRTWGPCKGDFEIKLPSGIPLEISHEKGPTRVDGSFGNLQFNLVDAPLDFNGSADHVSMNTVSSDARVALARVSSSTAVELKAVSGTTTLSLPPSASPRISQRSMMSSVRNDFGGPGDGQPVRISADLVSSSLNVVKGR